MPHVLNVVEWQPVSSTGFDLVNTSMQVLPDMFAPKELCDCLPGWNPACSCAVFFCFRVKESVVTFDQMWPLLFEHFDVAFRCFSLVTGSFLHFLVNVSSGMRLDMWVLQTA